jgi:hypothetical protein
MEATASCFTETLAISQTINIHSPKGGVIFPIIKAKLDTTPKRIGSIPTLFTTGIKSGIKIMIKEEGSQLKIEKERHGTLHTAKTAPTKREDKSTATADYLH